jgi:hypothetical protein
MPRFAATYLSFFAAKSVCIGVYPWLKAGSVAAVLLQVFRVFRGEFCSFFSVSHFPSGCGSAAPSGPCIPWFSSIFVLAAQEGAA